MSFRVSLSKIQALNILEQFSKEGTIEDIVYQTHVSVDVLDQKLQLGPGKASLPRVRPVGNVEELRKNLLSSRDDPVTLELETFGDGVEMRLDWFSQPN